MLGAQNVASNTTLDAVKAETDKIDAAPSDGLDGNDESTSYRVAEIERHLHHWERWFGAAAVPNGEIHVADSISTSKTAFQADAGNDTWGSWLQILGSDDTPATTGRELFDVHRLMVTAVENANNAHLVQIGIGGSGASALAAGTYTDCVFQPQSVQGQQTILDVQTRRQAVGTKAWLRAWVAGQNTSTVDFFVGIHEYEG